MAQVQVRVTENMIETLDEWMKEGKFKSRSDAIRPVLKQYEEREKNSELL
ncbi:MAG: ribbon-helix-helix domain-containing protein [Thermoplasmatota archaeon]